MTLGARRCADGHDCPVYEARPQTRPRGLIVVVHEIFGLTPHIRSVCDRLANAGYQAAAPDLFSRAKQGAPLPYTAEGKKEGLRIKAELTEELMLRDVGAVVQGAEFAGFQAVMGFCLGGTLAWMAADAFPIHAAIGYYAVGLGKHLRASPRCPVLLHFGRRDPTIPPTEVAAVAAAFPQVAVHEYDAGHAFNRDDDAAYVAAAAAQAWQRSLAFLEEHSAQWSMT